jgi:RNA polymerase sigma factor (sigma-70 family)
MVAVDAMHVAELVNAARAGNVAAFGELVDRFQPMARRYATSLLQDASLAEDACQEAFVDAYLHLRQLRELAAFPGWFRRIVVKHADRQRRSRLLFLELHEVPGAVDPLGLLIEAEARREIADQVAELPERLRRTVELFYGEGFSVTEISDFLNVPAGAVRKRLFDARRKLRGRIGEPEPTESHLPRDSVELLIASRTGDARLAVAILARRPDLANLTERWRDPIEMRPFGTGLSVLQRAVFMGRIEVATVLLRAGANPDPPHGMAPLDMAVLQRHEEMVLALLGSGAKVTRPSGELTPLHRAAMRGAATIARHLLAAGADGAAVGPGGRTPADWARLKGYERSAESIEEALNE